MFKCKDWGIIFVFSKIKVKLKNLSDLYKRLRPYGLPRLSSSMHHKSLSVNLISNSICSQKNIYGF